MFVLYGLEGGSRVRTRFARVMMPEGLQNQGRQRPSQPQAAAAASSPLPA